MFTIACHTWGFPDLTLSEALGTMARLGFRSADIAPGQGLALTRAVRQPRAAANEIRADLALFNLSLSDLFLLLPRISTNDAERRQREIDTFSALMPFAQALGTPGVTVSPGVIHNAEDDATAWVRTVEALAVMRDAAQAAGLAFSFAPHVDSMATTPERARLLLDALDGVSLTLDWPSLVYSGARHDEIAALIPRARHIQVRGAAKGQLQAVGERSRVDLPRLAADCFTHGYQGAVSISLLAEAGRHRVTKVKPIAEATRLRDALREAREAAAKL